MAVPKIARLGTPDMKPIMVGGPSAMGQAKGGAIEFLLGLVRQSIYYFGGRIQQSKAQKDLKSLGTRIDKDRRAMPTKGVLVSLQFIVQEGSKEAAGQGNAFRYTTYLYGKGATVSEARQDQVRHGLIREGTRSNEKYAYQPIWFPPLKATGRIKRPFPVIGHGCFVQGKVWLQNVQWTTIQGFDDEGKSNLAGSGNSFFFDILQPPTNMVTSHGATGVVKIPIKQRPVGSGGKSIPVVDLDTTLGNVTAAMVFPADAHTEQVFWRAPETKQKPLGTIRGITNFNRIRWIRPENIRLLKSP
ncbi:MAG: hypothetical protein SRB2_02575 [Desulfobacteraceae bacterium Eth-SRB2]|nr:MAG: hypothetical protein SRB2_02575 [Desulfobacteraceae bacterium Eth-SRB2]